MDIKLKINKIQSLKKEGLSIRDIAKEVGLSPSTVNRILKSPKDPSIVNSVHFSPLQGNYYYPREGESRDNEDREAEYRNQGIAEMGLTLDVDPDVAPDGWEIGFVVIERNGVPYPRALSDAMRRHWIPMTIEEHHSLSMRSEERDILKKVFKEAYSSDNFYKPGGQILVKRQKHFGVQEREMYRRIADNRRNVCGDSQLIPGAEHRTTVEPLNYKPVTPRVFF